MIVISIKDITYKYLKEKEIEYISLHDDLTGLYNRRFFKEELKRLFDRRSYPLALVIFDINGLKMVNDILGHTWGDWLIKKVAETLKSSVRAVDLIARIGGDEFVLLMVNTTEEGVKRCILRIKERLDEENKKESHSYLSVSIGYAIQNGKFKDSEKLFASADESMYKEKYSDKRNDKLKKIRESIKLMKPENAESHKLEDFLKR
ncbi:GGDEF domain-containing protein [Hippea maritima]|uniref:diguanylate cyclase n=1 Tax=Hippea maritima (strain ATCC 700847 / DSM 10411 / MH2) TaxID=760142 RepID=F2LVV2_HIPMA|nr:GGDEF domain-containing protein [Hippea maritima]AEA33886.1 diguanylate cyclase [Hippea maritima DSM 10411]